MRLYLAGAIEHAMVFEENRRKDFLTDLNVLISYAYVTKACPQYYECCKNILMDSGAFSVMNNKKMRDKFNPMEYCKKYAEHVKEYNIKDFVELDIESIYGFEIYRDCLHQLQDITGREPIYVFHKWRGIDYFRELVKQKNYIALGDVSVGAGSRELYKYFPWFIEEAHKNNCKIHGLAFTALKDLQFMNFDSVDSSSWAGGAKFAKPYRFNGREVVSYQLTRTETRDIPTASTFQRHDLVEWKKLSQYYDKEYEPIW